MTVKLNRRSCEHAKRLIDEGKFVVDEREAWAEHHPSTRIEEEFIEKNGLSEYRKWFLGVNDEHNEGRKRHYEFQYGDFENVHRCYSGRPKPGQLGEILRLRKCSGRFARCD